MIAKLRLVRENEVNEEQLYLYVRPPISDLGETSACIVVRSYSSYQGESKIRSFFGDSIEKANQEFEKLKYEALSDGWKIDKWVWEDYSSYGYQP